VSYSVVGDEELLGQFATNKGYADLIEAAQGLPVLEDFFENGETERVPEVVTALRVMAHVTDDSDIKTTARGLADLIKGQKSVMVTDGMVEDDGDEPVTKAGSGNMVAIFPAPGKAKELALEGGEDPEDLHITLAYLGSSEVGFDLRAMMETAVEKFAKEHGPIHGEFGGPDRFDATEHSDNMDVCIATFDSPDIMKFRRELVAALEKAGFVPRNDFKFTPHLTLKYIDPEDDLPEKKIDPTPVVFDSLVLCTGGIRKAFLLTNESVEKGYNPDQPRVPAGSPEGGQFGSAEGTVATAAEGRVTNRVIERHRTAILRGMKHPAGANAEQLMHATGWGRATAMQQLSRLRREGWQVEAQRTPTGMVYRVTGTTPGGVPVVQPEGAPLPMPPPAPPPGEPAPAPAPRPEGESDLARKSPGYLGRETIPDAPPGVAVNIGRGTNENFKRETGLTGKEYAGVLFSRFKPDEVRDVALTINPYTSGGRYSMQMRGQIKGEDGNWAHVSMTRSLDLTSGRVDHNYLSIGREGSGQGAGVGKKLFDASLDLYDHMGMKAINVHANIDVGGYAWARYGFVPDQGSWDSLRSSVRRYGLERDLKDASPAIKQKVASFLDNPDPTSIHGLSSIKEPWGRSSEGKSQTVGMALLKGADWFGKINLTDSKKYAQVRAYVSKKKAKP